MSAAAAAALKLFLVFILFSSLTEGREFLVGGKTDAWKIPSSPSDSLNKWAESARFRVGDSLVWKNEAEKDSVLQVTKEAYVSCNTTDPIAEYKDGNNTNVKLDRPGPFFFISGQKDHCQEGQKLIVVVMSLRNRFIAISPAPSPAEFEGPGAAAPTGSASTLQGKLLMVMLSVLGLWLALL